MLNAFPYKSSQIVAGSAVAIALLGAAFAVGRAQSPTLDPPAARPVLAAAPAHACERCARVTEVHSETRYGHASGVGAVGGAVVGGVLGSLVGGGNGKKLAAVAGAVGGGYAGNEIEKREKAHTVWVVQVTEHDGRMRRFERPSDPGVRVGDEVSLRGSDFRLI